MPFFWIDAFFYTVLVKYRNRVSNRCHRMRQQQHVFLVFQYFFDLTHMSCHDGTNSEASSKTEVCNVYFILESVLGNGVSQLIHQGKVRNAVVLSNVLNRSVYQFCIYHAWLVYGEYSFGL